MPLRWAFEQGTRFEQGTPGCNSGCPVLATFSIHTARAASRRPSVVVMQTIEDWECHDPTVSLGQSRHGLLLAQALMWPSLVVESDLRNRQRAHVC